MRSASGAASGADDAAPPSTEPCKTGQQLSEGAEPLTLASIRSMAMSQYMARRHEVDRFIAEQGTAT